MTAGDAIMGDSVPLSTVKKIHISVTGLLAGIGAGLYALTLPPC